MTARMGRGRLEIAAIGCELSALTLADVEQLAVLVGQLEDGLLDRVADRDASQVEVAAVRADLLRAARIDDLLGQDPRA